MDEIIDAAKALFIFALLPLLVLAIAIFSLRLKPRGKPFNQFRQDKRVLLGLAAFLGVMVISSIVLDPDFSTRHGREEVMTALIPVLLVGGFLWLANHSNSSAAKRWLNVVSRPLHEAKRLCGGAVENDREIPSFVCEFNGRKIRIWFELFDANDTSYITFHMAVSGRYPATICLTTENILNRLAAKTGLLREITCGEASFDEAYFILADDADRALSVLSSSRFRQWVSALMPPRGGLVEIYLYPQEIRIERVDCDPTSLAPERIRGIIEEVVGLARVAEGEPLPPPRNCK